ncbi:MAG: sulfide/dihydroorotate dehydrogenase-like FAD/NAD-binding protein [Candidatus Omnitrophica bacterium]|nr:sulfide/dihydroorotate dehydrogenase-like FAD/NAD-binding protein [Candidatus Omnitrophota bacterium]
MNQILKKEKLAENIKKITIEAPEIAAKAQAGQFVSLIVDKKGERIPLTIVESDRQKGTITLIFLEVGKTTFKLGKLEKGDNIVSLLGPLGKPTHIDRLGTVVTVGGGVGIAEVFPVTRAFKEAHNDVISIIGARSKNLLILEEPLRQVSDKLFVTTDDGSYGQKGFVSDVLKELLERQTKIDLVYAVGPVPMMRVVCEVTRPYKIKTLVSLNPIMVDATGMCGSCRVNVGGETKFGCVDGPEFDGHLVDFVELQKRLGQFCRQEESSRECCRKK